VAQLCVWDGDTLALENCVVWRWERSTRVFSVAVRDVDDDEATEIVTGGNYLDDDDNRIVAQLCVWTGSTLALEGVKTWYWVGDTYIKSVACDDVDGDDQTEIITGGFYIPPGTWALLCVWSFS
jgi:hypothetical protein